MQTTKYRVIFPSPRIHVITPLPHHAIIDKISKKMLFIMHAHHCTDKTLPYKHSIMHSNITDKKFIYLKKSS